MQNQVRIILIKSNIKYSIFVFLLVITSVNNVNCVGMGTPFHTLACLSTVAEIRRAVEEFQGLRALRLEGNTIGVEAAQSIAKALENKSELEVLITVHSVTLL